MNMPEQICTTCLNKLEVAYEFRQSCERSDTILQSFIENDTATTTTTTEYTYDRSVIVNNSESGTVYKYKPPDGLNIKRVKPEPVETNELIIKSEPFSDNELEIELSDESQSKVYRKVIRHPIRKNVAKQQKTVPSYPLEVRNTKTNKRNQLPSRRPQLKSYIRPNSICRKKLPAKVTRLPLKLSRNYCQSKQSERTRSDWALTRSRVPTKLKNQRPMVAH